MTLGHYKSQNRRSNRWANNGGLTHLAAMMLLAVGTLGACTDEMHDDCTGPCAGGTGGGGDGGFAMGPGGMGGHGATEGGEGGTSPASCAESATWAEQAKLVGDDTAGDSFGFSSSVAIDGDTVLVGAPNAENDDMVPSGAAYVFVRNGSTWSQQAKLTGLNAGDYDRVGSKVALEGDTAFVAAPDHDAAGQIKGAVFVFRRTGTTWTQIQTLVASDASAGNRFGAALAVHGGRLLVGRNSGDGSVYVFIRNADDWREVDILTPAAASLSVGIGSTLAYDGTTLITGIPTDTDAAQYSGAVLPFHRDGDVWDELPKLTSSDPSARGFFGRAVAVHGDLALVGAPRDGSGGESGALYVFRRTAGEWAQHVKVQAALPVADDRFGGAIAVSSEIAVIGAPGKPFFPSPSPGAAHIMLRTQDSVVEHIRVQASDGADQRQFGSAVAVDGCSVVVGGVGTGAAYVFE